MGLKYFVICPALCLNCCISGRWLQGGNRIPDLFVQQWKRDPLPAHVLGGEVTEGTCRGLRSTCRYVAQVIHTVCLMALSSKQCRWFEFVYTAQKIRRLFELLFVKHFFPLCFQVNLWCFRKPLVLLSEPSSLFPGCPQTADCLLMVKHK